MYPVLDRGARCLAAASEVALYRLVPYEVIQYAGSQLFILEIRQG